MQQIIVETLINTSVNYPSKHCQPTATIAVQFAIWQNQWMVQNQNNYALNRHDCHVHRTSSDPEFLVDEKMDDKDFF